MRYPLVFHTLRFLPAFAAGCALGPVIIIDPLYKNDEGLLQHELLHVLHWWIVVAAGAVLGAVTVGHTPYGYLPVLWGALAGAAAGPLGYLLIRPLRQWEEAHAYAKQMCYTDRNGGYLSLANAGWRLSQPQYRLNLSLGQAIVAVVDAE